MGIVCGIGVNDFSGKISHKGIHIPEYALWKHVLQRCTGNKRIEAYRFCKMSTPWLSFSKFYEDVRMIDNFGVSGFCFDKDILVKGNRVYGDGLCCFVPNEINTLFTNRRNHRGDYPVGVSFHKVTGMFSSTINIDGSSRHLGLFKTVDKAFNTYKVAKECHIKDMANRYKGLVSNNVYQAMMKYEVEFND